MSFSTPLALLLLLTIPYFIWLGRPSPGGARWREWLSLALRLTIAILLVLGLAGTEIVRAADDLAVVFLVDASDSVGPEGLDRAESITREAIESIRTGDQAAVVVFGADALVERPMSGLAELAPIASAPTTLQSNIAEALRLGLALFPAGSARRMVLISDGASTVGDPVSAALLAASSGVQVDVITYSQAEAGPEALLLQVEAPARVTQGEQFDLSIAVESNKAMPVTFRILAGGTIVDQFVEELRPGPNNCA